MRHCLRLSLILAVLLLGAGCGKPLESGDLSLSVDKAGKVLIASEKASSPLVKDDAVLSTITVGGERVTFGAPRISREKVQDAFGAGNGVVLESRAESGLVRRVSATVYDRYPSTLVVRAQYTNASDGDVAVDGWSVCDLTVQSAGDEPAFWSFQGQSTEEREDWILPLAGGFFQKNYMGMNNSDYGGGIPVVCLWRRDAGVMVGHLSPHPELVSLPVSMGVGDDFASVAI